jgi:Tfp pilus assembly protein PilO
MKTRKLLIIILVVALLVVYYLIGTDYQKQRRQYKALASQITEITQSLALVPAPPADLDQRLASAREELDAAKSSLPSYTNSTRIINTVLKLAEKVGVKAIPLATQPWMIESVGDQDYSVFHLDMAVAGTFMQLSSFLSNLETGKPETLVIEYLSVDRVTEASREESATGDNIKVNANLKIAIFSPPPSTD